MKHVSRSPITKDQDTCTKDEHQGGLQPLQISLEVPPKQSFVSATCMVDTGRLSGLAFQIVVYPPKISSQSTQDARSRQP